VHDVALAGVTGDLAAAGAPVVGGVGFLAGPLQPGKRSAAALAALARRALIVLAGRAPLLLWGWRVSATPLAPISKRKPPSAASRSSSTERRGGAPLSGPASPWGGPQRSSWAGPRQPASGPWLWRA
jgi:hypothetical protein